MMSTEQMRSEFEVWFKKEIIETDDFEFLPFDESEGEYIVTENDNVDLYIKIQMFYMGWQASRAALVVELPTQEKYDDPLSAYNAINDCKEIIRAAGITVRDE